MNTFRIKPAVLLLRVWHEHCFAATKCQTHDAPIARDPGVSERISTRTTKRCCDQLVCRRIVQQDPGRARIEYALHHAERCIARLCNIQSLGKCEARLDERLLGRSQLAGHVMVSIK